MTSLIRETSLKGRREELAEGGELITIQKGKGELREETARGSGDRGSIGRKKNLRKREDHPEETLLIRGTSQEKSRSAPRKKKGSAYSYGEGNRVKLSTLFRKRSLLRPISGGDL